MASLLRQDGPPFGTPLPSSYLLQQGLTHPWRCMRMVSLLQNSVLPKPSASTAGRSRWDADSDNDDTDNTDTKTKRAVLKSRSKKNQNVVKNSAGGGGVGDVLFDGYGGGGLGADDVAGSELGTVVGGSGGRNAGPPAYGKRMGFVPRSQADFGDGGAFPEIHMVQFPLEMGRRRGSGGGGGGANGGNAPTLSLQTDETGRIRYDLVLRENDKSNDKKIIHATPSAMKSKDIVDGDASFDRPDDEVVRQTTEKTRAALEGMIEGRLMTGKERELQSAEKKGPTFVRYTPADQSSGASTRIIKMVEAPVDPMEPPKFKHKKVPRGPPSPPPPVMHSPPRKVSVEDQRNWVIPPCISSWKNNKGYTIPLDKRLANDGRGLQQVSINDNFAKFAEALYIADRHAREEVRLRSDMQAKLAAKEKREKEQKLQMLAQKAREERAGLVSGTGEAPSVDHVSTHVHENGPVLSTVGAASNDDSARVRGVRGHRMRAEDLDQVESGRLSQHVSDAGSDHDDHVDDGEKLTEEELREARERDRLRRDKARQRERELRMTHMGSDAKARVLSQSTDRDISEKIALGLAQPTMSKETMYDQRLFNQSAGLSSGFGGDDSYGIYDKPLFQGSSAHVIYRPKNTEVLDDSVPGVHTEKLERLLSGEGGSGPAPHRGFQGTGADAGGTGGGASRNTVRDGPVAFEKESTDEFGFQDFMSTAKRGRGGNAGEGEPGKRVRH